MSHRPIIDAGPSLNFLSLRKERLLIGGVWRRLTPDWMRILPDDPTPELAAVVHRITRQPMEERLRRPKDLGETIVIAHAVVAAESGENVTILIDDGPGARLATSEIERLRRLKRGDCRVGSIRLVSTLTVLARAAGGQHITDKPRCAVSTRNCEASTMVFPRSRRRTSWPLRFSRRLFLRLSVRNAAFPR